MFISKSQSLKEKDEPLEKEWGVEGIYLKYVESDLIDPDWIPKGISPEDMKRRDILIQQQRSIFKKIKDMLNGNRRKKNGR
ncbi:MAG: hypothetical protein AB1567_10235 [bacterium]